MSTVAPDHMSLGRPPHALTIARVQAIEISVHWRWVPILLLGTWLLAHNVLPARFPSWETATFWLTAGAAVLAGEVALLLHELGHALLARSNGVQVTRIVFHGFHAETHVNPVRVPPLHETSIALAGPGVNVVLAAGALLLRSGLAAAGPLDALLLMLVLGNAAAAALSLLPLPGSDGARAISGLRRQTALEAEVAGQRKDEDDEDQKA